MTIYCKLCNNAFRSAKPDSEAQREVMEAMSRHLTARHQEQATALGQDLVTVQMLLATYMLLRQYVRIPDNEVAMLESFRENEAQLKELFAPDPAAPDPVQ